MYQTIIDQLKELVWQSTYLTNYYSSHEKTSLATIFRTRQANYLSAIDILRIIDGQDLNMNRRNATLTHTQDGM